MLFKSVLFFGVTLIAGAAAADSPVWGQCGGINWTGPTTCVSGSGCVNVNPYYFQCQPGAAAPSTTKTSAVPSSSSTKAPVVSSTSTTAPGSTPTVAPGSGPGTTLLKDWLWIRAVAAPNFHKYLQGEVPRTVGPAVLNSYLTAGQFNIVDGKLVQLISTSASPATLLYASVTPRVGTEMKLQVQWTTTPSSYGTFSFSGDTLQWTVAGIDRPNAAAWLVCESQHLYVNLGAYLYNTPAGCFDQTIHYYNAATAND
ncbi:hypothetical protein DFH27DRAFT_591316 [Peziza echinospora]|nr:hypothetical protein DFH27DRAFT_591316 [Peziza echinospora]